MSAVSLKSVTTPHRSGKQPITQVAVTFEVRLGRGAVDVTYNIPEDEEVPRITLDEAVNVAIGCLFRDLDELKAGAAELEILIPNRPQMY
ncbi:MAG: hypothetical protein RIC87_15495 [Kiloniellales bacterium]